MTELGSRDDLMFSFFFIFEFVSIFVTYSLSSLLVLVCRFVCTVCKCSWGVVFVFLMPAICIMWVIYMHCKYSICDAGVVVHKGN